MLQEDILVEKQIFSKKSQNLFGFQRSQIESQLNGADGWDLKTQWDILSKYHEIITKYPIVFSTLSRLHHSSGLNLASLKSKQILAFLWKDLFFYQNVLSKHFCLDVTFVQPAVPCQQTQLDEKEIFILSLIILTFIIYQLTDIMQHDQCSMENDKQFV